jgi:hypothetical protein
MRGSVKLSHAFNFRELDDVTTFESVSHFIQGCNKATFSVLSDAGNHGRDRFLAIDVIDDELFAKIVEDLSIEATRVRNDQPDVVTLTKTRENMIKTFSQLLSVRYNH